MVRGKFSKINSKDVVRVRKYLKISIYKRQKFEEMHPAKVGLRQSFKLIDFGKFSSEQSTLLSMQYNL